MKINQLKLDEKIGDYAVVIIRADWPGSFQVSGANAQREVIAEILDRNIQVVVGHSGQILYEGSILDLAVIRLRDIRDAVFPVDVPECRPCALGQETATVQSGPHTCGRP